jgi:uncharacterized protein (TIGR02118 family)
VFTVTFVLYEKDGLERAEALRYWREEHGPIVARVPGVQRYVQQHAVGAPDGTPPFLGVASLSFADQGAFEAAGGSPEFAAAIADVPNFADAQLPTAFTEDVVVVG